MNSDVTYLTSCSHFISSACGKWHRTHRKIPVQCARWNTSRLLTEESSIRGSARVCSAWVLAKNSHRRALPEPNEHPALIDDPIVACGIYIITAVLLGLHLPPLNDTSLNPHFRWEDNNQLCTRKVKSWHFTFEIASCWNKVGSWLRVCVRVRSRETFCHSLLLLLHHHYFSRYFLLREELAEDVFLFWGAGVADGEDEGRKQQDNSLRAVSVAGRLQENIRAALED